MKRRWFFIAIILVVLAAVFIYSIARKDKSVDVIVKVEQGQFDVLVSTTGELRALNSVSIRGPENMRDARVHNVKIVDLVPEGTVVKKGDYVATLDRTDATSSLQSMEDQIERDEASFLQVKLDTTMQLRNYRNTIKDLEYALEERRIILDQSKYEPPATIRQAEMNLDKAKRAYDQAVKNYSLKKDQAEASMTKTSIALKRQYERRDKLIEVLNHFVIKAPQDGMVIYKRDWGGGRRKVGSTISPWDPVIATLPDLTKMISITYVNEIDVSKVKVNQPVIVGVDAFPDRQYTGVVTEVANVGEQLPNSDAKVFEVRILLNESDTTLRPAMTTINQIKTNSFEDVLYIPLETVHNTDSMSYVYRADKKVRQIVDLGEANENYIVVLDGLSAGDNIYLTVPEKGDEWDFAGMDVYEKVKKRKIEEEKRRKEAAQRMHEMQQKRMDEMGRIKRGSLPAGVDRAKIQQMMRSRSLSGKSGNSRSGQSGSVKTRIQR
ncbi:MAG: efflux RND transporter periplasmic adaptor subunit [Bacteroidales bacterium]|nr:efflux RND transporter periplasmic adaptor subunit [Bacteroidales bacterium]